MIRSNRQGISGISSVEGETSSPIVDISNVLFSPSSTPSKDSEGRIERSLPSKIFSSIRNFFKIRSGGTNAHETSKTGENVERTPFLAARLLYAIELHRRHSLQDLLTPSTQTPCFSGGSSSWLQSPSLSEAEEIAECNTLHSSHSINYHSLPLRCQISLRSLSPTIVRRPRAYTRGAIFDSICNSADIRMPIASGNLGCEFTPSLKTIEITSDTKIYLETHFNDILANPNARSLRRRAMECRLEKSNLMDEERSAYRDAWKRKEGEYLRNSWTNKITLADFDIIKVIGKGAFGCLKLAKMKEPFPNQSNYLHIPKNNQTDKPSKPILEPKKLDQQPKGFDPASVGQVFALKVIPKAEHLKNGHEGHLRAERDFLVVSEGSRWVVPLIASFQDDNNLYLAMEYMIGGDFLGLLIEKISLSESVTRFYVAEMILCIEEAHKLSYIHRDIKPDNFCFSSTGHIKICDFGLAFSGHWFHDSAYFDQQRWGLLKRTGVLVQEDEGKDVAGLPRSWRYGDIPCNRRILSWRNKNCKREMANSIVGTYQYMAPEILRGQRYDGRCDWWSLGVIIYECLFGFTPFYANGTNETRSNVLNWPNNLSLERMPPLSADVKSLISSLICEKESRLGSAAYDENDTQTLPFSGSAQSLLEEKSQGFVCPNDSDEIKSHPFFLPINWKTLHLQTPPFVPEGLKGSEDTKYFSEYQLSSTAMTEDETSCIRTGQKESMYNKPSITNWPNCVSTQRKKPDIEKMPNNPNASKRPKDLLLRDKKHRQELLETRQKNAFKGYTYRRPLCMEFVLKNECFDLLVDSNFSN